MKGSWNSLGREGKGREGKGLKGVGSKGRDGWWH